MLFALPAAIAVPIIAGILLGGPMLGFPVAAVVAILIVGVAIRMEPRGAAAPECGIPLPEALEHHAAPAIEAGAAPRPGASWCRWRSRWRGSS
jgi:hypothetical protein